MLALSARRGWRRLSRLSCTGMSPLVQCATVSSCPGSRFEELNCFGELCEACSRRREARACVLTHSRTRAAGPGGPVVADQVLWAKSHHDAPSLDTRLRGSRAHPPLAQKCDVCVCVCVCARACVHTHAYSRTPGSLQHIRRRRTSLWELSKRGILLRCSATQ